MRTRGREEGSGAAAGWPELADCRGRRERGVKRENSGATCLVGANAGAATSQLEDLRRLRASLLAL